MPMRTLMKILSGDTGADFVRKPRPCRRELSRADCLGEDQDLWLSRDRRTARLSARDAGVVGETMRSSPSRRSACGPPPATSAASMLKFGSGEPARPVHQAGINRLRKRLPGTFT